MIRRALALGIAALEQRNGGAPVETVRVFGEIAEAAGRFRAHVSRLDGGSGTGSVPLQRIPGSSVLSEAWLSTAEAAHMAGVSTGYLRRLVRQGRVIARQAGKGGYEIDRASFAAWCDDRNKEREVA